MAQPKNRVPVTPRPLCAICRTPIRMTRRGWQHVKALARLAGHRPLLMDSTTIEEAAQESRG